MCAEPAVGELARCSEERASLGQALVPAKSNWLATVEEGDRARRLEGASVARRDRGRVGHARAEVHRGAGYLEAGRGRVLPDREVIWVRVRRGPEARSGPRFEEGYELLGRSGCCERRL